MRRVMLVLAALWLAGVAHAGASIRIVGSTTVLPIVAEAAKVYRQDHPGLVLTVSGGGSGVGVAGVRAGSADLGMVSRPLTSGERQALGKGLQVVTVARDAVAVVVSKAVYVGGVRKLSLAQIAAIYRGRIRNWQALGGPDRPILVLDKEPSRGTRHVFAKAVLGNVHARAPGASLIVGSNNEEQAVVARSDGAIGMLSNAWLNDRVRAVAVGEGEAAVLPTLEHVRDGSYPIQRSLDILVPQGATPAARDFVAFLRSARGQQIVRETGYLPIR